MRLSDVLPSDIAAPQGFASLEVTAITSASATAGPGIIFAGLPGAKADGAAFIPDAVARGSKTIIVGREKNVSVPSDVALIEVDNPRRVLALVAARLAGRQPSIVVTVTGTSGKTSVADFARQIFAYLGRRAASVGTIGVIKPDGAVYGSLTTPDAVSLHAMLADLADDGVTHLAFEASSHGLDQHRLDGVVLTAAAFTNLGRDHLDYHATVEDYFSAKLRLFSELLQPGQTAVINADGDAAARVADVARVRGLKVMTVGRNGRDLRLVGVTPDGFRQVLVIEAEGRWHTIDFPLVGAYQVENALVAAGLAIAAGEDTDAVLNALAHLKGVPGRLEIAGEAKGGLVIVDYAHKPEALAAALDACRPFVSGKLISVFGCGGDRDKGKRPLMGRISAGKADVTIITDDNPRSEDAAVIRSEVLAGAPGAREIGDRAEAIRTAIAMMGAGDVVLVAGKGHETGQIVGDRVIPFSDHGEIIRALQPYTAPDVAPLWTWSDLVAAAGGRADASPDHIISGFSIDTRSLQTGDVFVALKDQRDGHDFVTSAFQAGAAAAIVAETYQRRDGDGALLRTADPLRALADIGRAARARLSGDAVVFAVTGSVGKTGTKEMLRACLSRIGTVHASEKSYNNHWGVPLTLARMPAETQFAVFEIGMNHSDEIRPLTKMVRPHVAIVTTVEAVHLENFKSVEEIADAKAEIFDGLEPGGTAVIKQDNAFADRLAAHALKCGADVTTFGIDEGADVFADKLELGDAGSHGIARFRQEAATSNVSVVFDIAIPGRHIVENALAVIAALHGTTTRLTDAVEALASLPPPAGRGVRTRLSLPGGAALLIDESYNANPASMRAALATLGNVPRNTFARRIAVLGDMLELGRDAAALHAGLKVAVEAAEVDLVFACGPLMKGLYDAISKPIQGGYAETAAALLAPLTDTLRPGDVVMLKASNGTRLGSLVDALKTRFAGRVATL